jgi:predicted HTH domain antitoxin
MDESAIEVTFTVPVAGVPELHRAEAERMARQAYVPTLLQQGDISAGRAAELLSVNRWQLGEIMSAQGISPFDDSMTREDLEREVAEPTRLPESL